MTFAAIVAAGYLLGSCPWGYWLVRLFHGADVRSQGSGATGASNVWRAYGPRLGHRRARPRRPQGVRPGVRRRAPGLDALRDPRRRRRDGRPLPAARSSASGRAGRWSRPPGGVVIAVAPWVALAIAAVWLVTFALTRYTSVASIVSAFALPLAAVGVRLPGRGDRVHGRLGGSRSSGSTAGTSAASGPAPRTGSGGAAEQRSPDDRRRASPGSSTWPATTFARRWPRSTASRRRSSAQARSTTSATSSSSTRRAGQIAVLVDQLGLAARIASGRYDPHLVEANTLELAAASGVPASGEGAAARDRRRHRDAGAHGARGCCRAVRRRGPGRGPYPVATSSLRRSPARATTEDVGALVARAAVAALGGSVELDGETLRVRL